MQVDLSEIQSLVNVAEQSSDITSDMLKTILSVIDLTSLNDTDDETTISALCHKAMTAYGHVAAVCVYPKFVRQAALYFASQPIKIATVVNFPSGDEALHDVICNIRDAIQNGAHEIDVVFPYSTYLAGNTQIAHDFIRACKEACGEDILLKVILETGVLKELSLVEAVSRSALLAGADFLKTSTGKVAVGATMEAAATMLLVIREMTPEIKRPLGFKASGGVRNVSQAAQYITLANQIMGRGWVSPQCFRLGASQLLDGVIEAFGA